MIHSAALLKDGGPKPLQRYSTKKSTKNMQQFAVELQTAVNRSLPSNIKPYNGVYVLATHWSNDKMGSAALEDDLCQCFASVYGYTVEKYLIDATLTQYNTRDQFRRRMQKFIGDYNKQGNLLIVVYSGHASHMNAQGQYQLGGDLDIHGYPVKPTLDWNQDAAPYITDTDADVLIITDCCFASSTAVDNSTGPEVLAASTWHTSAGDVPLTSFTKNLINELNRLNGDSASVASIYAQIHRSTRPYEDILAGPLHIAKTGRDSIILTKLQPPTPRNRTIIGPLQPNDERVVVTVHLSDHNGVTPDLQQWTTWLTSNLPSHISKTQISIEGVFDTDSFIILVSMPLEVWTMLPNGDETYGFVSFVKSGNRLLPGHSTSSQDSEEIASMASHPKDRRGIGDSSSSGSYDSAYGGFSLPRASTRKHDI